jgi:hypothetical protein
VAFLGKPVPASDLLRAIERASEGLTEDAPSHGDR